ncbi:L-threonylcarbamoyladenylate synthase [Roseivivax halotolerans]|uniref:Threonylcarbamoyl-AMP synthase n=1 Tax=Roseivivax halotolerans TaxID=93684 RepID=A0A1I5YQ90_9RHOB|nr:L-threonylcarbamoyladenylate synthase [Roseivivax halotolerans]SFQ46260.1 L-threonylcarbamoyladenylate synthase [Roseivivax halotolerans]
MTERLTLAEADIVRAAEIWRAGGLVAFPTETVYGLGADAGNDKAVAAIFAAKDRPSFNPLITHVASLDQAKALAVWSDRAEALAAAYWPGPLTLVLPLRDGAPVSGLVTAGLDTIGIRMPAHPVARRLLTAFGRGVAAPSANRSGRISPTRAEHVLDTLDGRIDAVVAGGASQVGLESTILGLTGKPTLLRPGGITAEALVGTLGTHVFTRRDTEAISAPGQTPSHYAPRATLRLNAAEWQDGEATLGFGDMPCDLNLSQSEDLSEAAANLFAHLHALDRSGREVIAVAPVPHRGLGIAINDRLSRAAAPR